MTSKKGDDRRRGNQKDTNKWSDKNNWNEWPAKKPNRQPLAPDLSNAPPARRRSKNMGNIVIYTRFYRRLGFTLLLFRVA